MIVALGNGSVDAGMVAEPIPTRAVASGVAVRWNGSNEFYPDLQAAVLMYSPTFGKEKPEAARRFMVAYVQGLRTYEARPAGPHQFGRAHQVRHRISPRRFDPGQYGSLAEGTRPAGRDGAGSLAQRLNL